MVVMVVVMQMMMMMVMMVVMQMTMTKIRATIVDLAGVTTQLEVCKN